MIFNEISYHFAIYQSKDHRTRKDPKSSLSSDTMQTLEGEVTKAQKS